MRVAPRLNRSFVAGLLCGVLIVFAVRFVINETPIPDWIVSPLLLPDTEGDADAIVVLGAGLIGECVPNLSGVRRVLLAARLWREKRAPIVAITGGPGALTCPVSVAMARFAREVGLPESSLLIERESQTTWENGELAAPLLRRAGVKRVLVVTDRLHMRRAAGVFTQLGFQVGRASVPIYESHPNNVSMLSAGAREFAALTYYRMRGWVAQVVHAAERDPADRETSRVRERVDIEEAWSRTDMQAQVTNPDGPIVVLGASYAGGWLLDSISGIQMINKGVSGQQSFEMLERFEGDVVAERPRAVILWGFINDIFRADDIDRALARVRESYTTMISRARASGIEPILATEVTVRPPDTWTETVMSWVGWVLGKESYQDRINRYVMSTNHWLREVAQRERLLLLDFHGVLADEAGRRRAEFIQPDGSHMTPRAYDALTKYAEPILSKHFAALQDR